MWYYIFIIQVRGDFMNSKLKSTNITIKMTPDEKQKLEDFAQDQGITMSQIVRSAIREYIRNHEE